eukprot:g8655.t1
MSVKTASVEPSETTDTPLLKLESSAGMMMGKGITTMQFYKGNKEDASTFLKERLKLIAEQNPWICASLVKDTKQHGKLIALRYPKNNVSTDNIFKVDHSLKISKDMPYQEIVDAVKKSDVHVDTGYSLCKSGDPITKCTVASSSTDDTFVVFFSISHACADGFTYYTILNMLFDGAEIFALEAVRNEKYRADLPEKIGKKASKWMMNPGCGQIMNFIGLMCCGRKNQPVYCFLVDPKKLTEAKENAKQGPNAPEFVSTNDILTSGFGRTTNTRLLTMAMDFRGRVDGLTKKTAGCYHAGLLFDPDAYSTPGNIRQALAGPAPQSRVGSFPGCCGSISGNWTAMITNWGSASKGNYDIPGCEHLLHIPYVQTNDMPVDFAIVFKARKGETAVMLGFQYGKDMVDIAKAELPIDQMLSEKMFS